MCLQSRVCQAQFFPECGRMPKKKLRQTILAMRQTLSGLAVDSLSLLVQKQFIESEEFEKARTLALYAPIRNEVGTLLVFSEAVAAGKTVLFPIVSGDGLQFGRISCWDQLATGAFGIPEPDRSLEQFEPEEADSIVIPGVVFDLKGNRIGFGKGYYDKAFHDFEGKGKLVGFCYEFQLVEEIRGEPHDVMMDMLITEKRVIRPRD